MASITYSDFSVGLDHRKSASSSDPNRLRELKNAYVTDGKAIRKRPGLTLVADFEVEDTNTGTIGLVSGKGKLNTFYPYSATTITHANTDFVANQLIHTASAAYGQPLVKIHQGDVFSITDTSVAPPVEYQPALYVSAEYQDGEVFHYFIDGSDPNLVTDTTKPFTPKSKVFTKQGSRIFVLNGSVIQHCQLSDVKDWNDTTASTGAGYVDVGRQSRGSDTPLALGQYDGDMAVFFADGVQTWSMSTDAQQISFKKYVPGVGTKWPKTPIEFAGDLLFLSKSGFRSLTTQSYTTNLQDSDVGSPIDPLVKAEVGDATDAISVYFSGANQYWCAYPISGGTRVWVYTFSKSDKITAWSKYEYGISFDAMASHNGYLYVRSGEKVYRVDETETVFDDNGLLFDMQVDFPFLHFKTPGILKHIKAMDIVVTGTVDVQFKYDPNDETRLTDPITVTGDSRTQQTIPLEITVPALAPVFTSSTNANVEIHSMTFYYDNLGAF